MVGEQYPESFPPATRAHVSRRAEGRGGPAGGGGSRALRVAFPGMRSRTRPQSARPAAGPAPRRAAPRVASWRVSALVGLAALAAYLWLAPTASGDRDSSEFTLVLALDGIAHPTGYPLYTLFGHAFVTAAHALGAGWPFAANAWSALGGAVAMALLHALAVRLPPPPARAEGLERRLPPLLPVAFMLFHPAWTQVTTVAEVYSWHLAWVLALAVRFASWPAPGAAGNDGGRAGDRGRAIGWGLLCGAGLAHHLTSVLVMAPLTLALVAIARPGARRGLGLLAAAAVGALVPLTSVLFLRAKMVHAGPAHWPMLEDSWAGFWAHVTGSQYRGLFGRFAPEPLDRQLIEAHVFPFLALGAVALLAAWRLAAPGRGRAVLAGLAAAAALQAGFTFLYGVEDPSAYFVPALALGLAALAPAVAGLAAAGRSAPRAARALAVGLAVVAVALSVPWARSARQLRATFIGLDGFVHAQWERITVERGIVLWPRDMYQRLREYQLLGGEKPGLDVLNPHMFPSAAVRRRFTERHGFDPVGELRMSPEDMLAPAGESAGGREFALALARRINERTPLPVVLFEPELPRVTVLPKPRAPSEGAPHAHDERAPLSPDR